MLKKFFSVVLSIVIVLGICPVVLGATDRELSGEFMEIASLNQGRYASGVAAYDGKVYVVGGCITLNGTATNPTNLMEVYDPNTDTWETLTPMEYRRMLCGVAAIDGKIYVMGGTNVTNTNGYNYFEVYDIAEDSWSQLENMPFSGYGNETTITVGQYIYVFGNITSPQKSYRYDTIAGVWESIADFPISLSRGVRFPVVYEGKLLICCNNGSIYQYDPLTNNYSEVINTGLTIRNAAVLDGQLLLNVASSGKSVLHHYDLYEGDTIATYELGELSISMCVMDDALYLVSSSISSFNTLSNHAFTFRFQDILSILMEIGETTQLSVERSLLNNSNYQWTSNDPTIASVKNNGIVEANAVGLTRIYAEKSGEAFQEFVYVKVVNRGNSEDRRLTLDLNIGESQPLHYSDAAGTIWSSMDPGKVSVDTNGVVTALESGLTIVTAERNGRTGLIYVRTR